MKSIWQKVAILVLGWQCVAADSVEVQPRVLHTADGFAVPQLGYEFVFPRDHGSHPDFKIEWWYITGHLRGEKGRRFGYQATFFRQAGPVPDTFAKEPGDVGAIDLPVNDLAVGSLQSRSAKVLGTGFAHAPLYLAHMAVVDVATGEFLHQERLNRAGWDAGASTESLDVWNGNWTLRQERTGGSGTEQTVSEAVGGSGGLLPSRDIRMWLHGGVHAEVLFELELQPIKPLVFFGENGVSRKAAEPTAASYYLTFPRLKTKGTLIWKGQRLAVTGLSWMDHEISSSQLSADQAGWDWASIQLNDGRDLMVYRMRRLDGTTDLYSRLAWVDATGGLTQSGPDTFEWTPLEHWKSAVTGGDYPIRSRLKVRDPMTGAELILTLDPLVRAQEMTGKLGGVAYWEGACRVLDSSGREIGQAYVELAGYVGRLADRF